MDLRSLSRRTAVCSAAALCLMASLPRHAAAVGRYVETNDGSRPVLGVLENPALNDEATAIWVNPAGLAFREGGTGFLSQSFRDPVGDMRYTNILLAGGSGGFGFQRTRISNTLSVDRWSLAMSGGSRRLGIASGLTIRITDPDGYWNRDWHFSADFGMLIRPTSWLSIGAVARQLGAPEEYPTSVEGGVALRPFGNQHLTLMGSYAYSFESGTIDDHKSWQVGAALDFGPGFIVSGGINNDKTVLAGLTFEFGNAGIAGGGFGDSDNRGPYFGAVRFSQNLRRTALSSSGMTANIRVRGPVEDVGSGGFFSPRIPPLHAYITQINRAAEDPGIGGIYLRLDNVEIGRGLADELRAALVRYKERTGNPIICYMAEGSDNEYYIASVADSIFMEPVGYLGVDGYVINSVYLARAFEKLGIDAEMVRHGRFKSAIEMFEDSTMSADTRLQLTEFLDEVYRQYVDAVAVARGMSSDSLRALIDAGPYTPQQALAVGLIDGLHDEHDAREHARDMIRHRAGSDAELVSMSNRRPYNDSWARRQTVAVIYASGDIVTGGGGSDFITGTRFIGSERMIRLLRRVREDDDIKAVVLRIDSPGGSGLASDQIWHELNRLHESGKPLVVSTGNLAASGGYYLACRADTIVANPSSIVGSIGVFGGKVNLSGLLDKLGIDTESITRGENATTLSLLHPLTDRQRENLQRHIDTMYDVFVSRVAESRGMTTAQVDSIGQGRIYSGERGVANGLIDLQGGLEDAILIARDLAGIRGDVDVVTYPERGMMWEMSWGEASLIRLPSSGVWYYNPVSGVR